MEKIICTIFALACLISFANCLVSFANKEQEKEKKPNVIFVFSDDQRFNSLSMTGDPDIIISEESLIVDFIKKILPNLYLN